MCARLKFKKLLGVGAVTRLGFKCI